MYLNTKSGHPIELLSTEEDAKVTRQAIEDGTYMDDEALERMVPVEEADFLPESFKQAVREEAAKRRGRPKGENNKIQLSVRYSVEVVEYFKSLGKGWQTRMDEVLREYVASHSK